VFTKILRDIVNDTHGEKNKIHYIVFDGEVDPEWVENLNSVLDDNKMFTLSNGERLPLPNNVRILFEVQNLAQATPATISRCGMLWLSEEFLSHDMIINSFLCTLTAEPLNESSHSVVPEIQLHMAQILSVLLGNQGCVMRVFERAAIYENVFGSSFVRSIQSLLSLLKVSMKEVLDYNLTQEIPLDFDYVENYLTISFYSHLAWAFGGILNLESRAELETFIVKNSGLRLQGSPFLYECDIASGKPVLWSSLVPRIDIDPSAILEDFIVPTEDTLKHEKLIYSWLSDRKPIVICGPPGSGKVI
jgi:dynein heavy chain 1